MTKVKVKIVEEFVSIQGESRHAGVPCYFVRFHGCNQNCSYCDTPYSHNPEEYKEVTTDEIIARISETNVKYVELTGGEPLLQKEACIDLINRLSVDGYTVLIETNGTVPIVDIISAHTGYEDQINFIMDIKCPSSGVEIDEEITRQNIDHLENWDDVKFVIGTYDDWDFMRKWAGVINSRGLAAPEVLLSPVWGQIQPHDLVGKLLHDKDLHGMNIRFQLQLHKIVWNANKRGV